MFGPVWGVGDAVDDLGDDLFGAAGVGVEVTDDSFGGDGFFLDFPAVVVSDHGEGGEGDFGFAGEFGFGEVGHADDVEAEFAVGFAFGAGGESGAVHADVGAARVDGGTGGGGFLSEERAEMGGDGIAEGDVGDDAAAEEGVLVATAGAVEELVGEEDVFGGVFLLEAADGGDGDDPADVEVAHGPEVGAVVEFGGENAVAAGVAGEEDEAAAVELADDEGVGRGAEWGVDEDFLTVGEAVDVIEAAAADDADGGRLVDGEGVQGGEIHPPKVRRMRGGSTDECDRMGERLFFCRGRSGGGLGKGGERGELGGEFTLGGDVTVGDGEGVCGFAEGFVGGFGGGLGGGDFEGGEAGQREDGVIRAVVVGHGGAVVEQCEFGALLFLVEVAAKVGEGGDEACGEVLFEGRLEAGLFGGGGVDELVQVRLQGLQIGFGEDGPAAEVVEVDFGEVAEDEGLGELAVHGGGEFGEFAEAFEGFEMVEAGQGAVAVFPGDEGRVVVGKVGESGFGVGVVAGVEAGKGGAPAFGFLDIEFDDVGVENLDGVAALGGVADDEAVGFSGDEEAGVALTGGGDRHDGEGSGGGLDREREGEGEKE